MIFFIVFSSVLLIIYSYIGWRLFWPLAISFHYKTILIILLIVLYCLPIINIAFYFNKIENNFTRIIAWLGYTGLGTVSLLFFMQISVDLLSAINTIFISKSNFQPQRRAFIGLSLKGIIGAMGALEQHGVCIMLSKHLL